MITLKDFLPNNIPTQKQVDSLAQFMIENFEGEIGKNGKGNGEGAIEMAVRLLLELKTIREKAWKYDQLCCEKCKYNNMGLECCNNINCPCHIQDCFGCHTLPKDNPFHTCNQDCFGCHTLKEVK